MPSSRFSSAASAHLSETLNLNRGPHPRSPHREFDDPGIAPCADSACILAAYPVDDESFDCSAFSSSCDCDHSSCDPHAEFADSDKGFLEPDFAASAPLLADENHTSLSRCSSSSSIITHATLRGSGRIDQADQDTGTLDSHWTDDKHKSYLTFMEENFVRDMYDREYCALDLCGQAPCTHSEAFSESEPSIHQFKSWKDGDWQWRSMSKHFSNPSKIHQTLSRNPWINHFWQSTLSCAEEVNSTQKKNKNGNHSLILKGNSRISERVPCCQGAESRKIDNTSNEDSRGLENWQEINKSKNEAQHSRKPGKRNLQLTCEWRTSRRQKLFEEHNPADDGDGGSH